MTRLALFIFLCWSAAVQAAAPVLPAAVDMVSRTSGAAPLCVRFSAAATTSDKTYDFHELFHTANFGKSNAGTWSVGAVPGASKNFHSGGPISASCYNETATWRWTVTDGSLSDTETGTITVTPANTQWATTKTKCVSGAGAGNFTDCPSGATQVNSSNATTAVSGNIGSGDVRILFRCGETFDAATAVLINQNTGYLGTYGSCGRAIINATGSGIQVTVSDWRIVGLEIVGGGGNNTIGLKMNGASKLTVMDSYIHNFMTQTDIDTGQTAQEVFFIENTLGPAATAFNGINLQIKGDDWGVLGNTLHSPLKDGFHNIRLNQSKRSIIAHNFFGANDGSAVENVSIRAKLHATDADDTQYVVVQYNKFESTGNASLTVKASTDEDARIFDLIIEKNLFTWASNNTAGGSHMSVDTGTRISVRNNLFLTAGYTGTNRAISFSNSFTSSTVPDLSWINNNSVYSSDPTTVLQVIQADDSPTNVNAANNLAYAPEDASAVMFNGTFGTGGNRADGNSSNAQIRATDPFEQTPSTNPQTYRPSAAGYADTGGTAAFPASVYDFGNCTNGANIPIGAWHPKTSICTGAAKGATP